MDPGINKPFDRAAKEFAEEAPLVFLRVLGMVPPGVAVDLEPLRPETAPQVLMPDYVATLAIGDQAPVTFHVEFFVQYREDIPLAMAKYGGSLAWQYQRPVQSVLLMLRQKGVPDRIPEFGEYAIGQTRLRHPFRTVRLWEVDPGPVMAAGDPALLPWAVLMRLGREEAAKVGAALGKSKNQQWIARFLTLGSLRYDREELTEMLGGPRMGLVEAIMEGSSLVREAKEQAAAEGREEGRTAEVRRLLRLALSTRFPGLDTLPELDRIQNIDDLEGLLLQHAFLATDPEQVKQAILEAASRN